MTQYIEIATGADADIFAQAAGWEDYAQHVADSGRDAGYYIADSTFSSEPAEFTAEELQTAEVIAVNVVCNVAESFAAEEMRAVKINDKLYVNAQEFEEYFC